jgi:hypothetical protein
MMRSRMTRKRPRLRDLRRKREIAETIKREKLRQKIKMGLPVETEDGLRAQSLLVPHGPSQAQIRRRSEMRARARCPV